jgi:hypothetical protein
MSSLRYYRRLLQVFRSYEGKKTVLPYLPVRLWIETTSICNLRCVMCPNKDLTKDEKGFMDLALFRKVIDEAGRFVFDVNLIHRGEGLLHRIFPRCGILAPRIARSHQCHPPHEPVRRLVLSNLDQISFSFDGSTRRLTSIRINADFDKRFATLSAFEIRGSAPETLRRFRSSISRISPGRERAPAQEFLHFRGLPRPVEIKEMHNWAGEIPAGTSRKKYVPCTFLWQALVIFWDGAVLPCTQDFHGYYSLERPGRDPGPDLE